MKRFTVGITTHNEEATIATLLTALATLGTDKVDVILYDDYSTDRTKEIVLAHPIAKQGNFHSRFAELNNGTPSVGRTYIGKNANTEYVALVDGDDFIDVKAFHEFIHRAPSGYDLLLTPYLLRGEPVPLKGSAGPLEVDNNSIMRILSGIGGKAYRTALLAEYGSDPVKGRSDDVRLNMRIMLSGKRKLFQFPETCFYVIDNSRKSMRVATLNFDEIEARVTRYVELENLYPIDRRYLAALKRNLNRVISGDASVSALERSRLRRRVDEIFKFDLKRIVFIAGDLSDIGGIPQRVRSTINASKGRRISYHVYCVSGANGKGNVLSEKQHKEKILAEMKSWNGCDTVFITANRLLKGFSSDVRKRISKFPLIYMSSAQLSFFVQDTSALVDVQDLRNFRVSKVISFSDADISFQRQLGIHGQIKGFLPVEIRQHNTFNAERNRFPGYVGRVDFHAKGCERLIPVARAMKEAGLPPIKLFTTAGRNSPDYGRFVEMIREEGLADQFDITLECTDKDAIYRQISMLLLPSKKESFGNVILEAYSYGIPVIGTTYAPGPSELIEHRRTGYLLDEFSEEHIVELFQQTDTQQLKAMSAAAFEKHKNYSMDAHFDFLEKVATDVLHEFTGQNTLPVFPELKIAKELGKVKMKLEDLHSFEDLQLGEDAAGPIPDAHPAINALAKGNGTSDITPRRHYVKTLTSVTRLAAEIARLEKRLEAKRKA